MRYTTHGDIECELTDRQCKLLMSLLDTAADNTNEPLDEVVKLQTLLIGSMARANFNTDAILKYVTWDK